MYQIIFIDSILIYHSRRRYCYMSESTRIGWGQLLKLLTNQKGNLINLLHPEVFSHQNLHCNINNSMHGRLPNQTVFMECRPTNENEVVVQEVECTMTNKTTSRHRLLGINFYFSEDFGGSQWPFAQVFLLNLGFRMTSVKWADRTMHFCQCLFNITINGFLTGLFMAISRPIVDGKTLPILSMDRF